MKAAIENAFDQLGVGALVERAEKNRTDFYKLWSKLLPKNLEVGGNDGEPPPEHVWLVGGGSSGFDEAPP